MNTYGFTIRKDDGGLLSWIVEAKDRRAAYDKLTESMDPSRLLILTCRLTDAQRFAWVQTAQDHGGFDDQMARSILNVY
jgi:hypothetical protein